MTGSRESCIKKAPLARGFSGKSSLRLASDYGATEQVAVLLLQVVCLTPGVLGVKSPLGMAPALQALFLGVGMVMLDIDADSHAFEKALASAKQALSAERIR